MFNFDIFVLIWFGCGTLAVILDIFAYLLVMSKFEGMAPKFGKFVWTVTKSFFLGPIGLIINVKKLWFPPE